MKGTLLYLQSARVFNEAFTKKGDFGIKNTILFGSGAVGIGPKLIFSGGILISRRIP
jgi:hypothetical protein